MTQTGGKIYHDLGLEESILSKWLYYPIQSTDSMQSLSNYQWHFFTELEQIYLKIYWKHRRPWIAKAILRKKNSWRNQAPRLQTIPQSYSHQNSMVLAQNINIDQWKSIESPEINPCTYDQLIYNKVGKTIQWRKDSPFNKWCWEN